MGEITKREGKVGFKKATDLADFMSNEPEKVIGGMPARMTDSNGDGFYLDAAEQAKYGLDKDGNPTDLDLFIDESKGGKYHALLADGFDDLGDDYDDEAAGGISGGNDPLAPSGFNDW